MLKDHDTIEIDEFSGAGLCVLCDNAIEEGQEGIIYKSRHAYIAHDMCIQAAWEEDDE